ncbi:MAG: hypothetical protein ACI8W3_003291 [Myxococcota bacterium]|jgi:hypothetical protein
MVKQWMSRVMDAIKQVVQLGAPGRRTERSEAVEFKDVFDQVLEEGDWVWLRAGALERSWRAEGAPAHLKD